MGTMVSDQESRGGYIADAILCICHNPLKTASICCRCAGFRGHVMPDGSGDRRRKVRRHSFGFGLFGEHAAVGTGPGGAVKAKQVQEFHWIGCGQGALTTRPDLMHEVQTTIFLGRPFCTARTLCRLGLNRRLLTLWAWLT